MLDVRLTRTVAADPDTVWRFVAEDFFANHRKWDPAIVELRQLTPAPIGEGTRGVEVRQFGGRQEAEFVVTAFVPRQRFAFSNTTGPFALERSYDFTASGFTFHFRMAGKGMMRLLFPLLRGTIAKQVEGNIDRLCGLLDAWGPTA